MRKRSLMLAGGATVAVGVVVILIGSWGLGILILIVGLVIVILARRSKGGDTVLKTPEEVTRYVVHNFEAATEKELVQAHLEIMKARPDSFELQLLYALRVSKNVPAYKNPKTLARRWSTANFGAGGSGLQAGVNSPNWHTVHHFLADLYLNRFNDLCSGVFDKTQAVVGKRKTSKAKRNAFVRAQQEIEEAQAEFAYELPGLDKVVVEWTRKLAEARQEILGQEEKEGEQVQDNPDSTAWRRAAWDKAPTSLSGQDTTNLSEDYWDLLEQIKECKRVQRSRDLVEFCARSISCLSALVRETKREYGQFDIQSIPAIEEGCKYWSALGDTETLTALREVVASTPELQPWEKTVSEAFDDEKLARRVESYVAKNPGTVQSELGRRLDVDGNKLRWICYYLDRVARLRRVKAGRSYALYPVE